MPLVFFLYLIPYVKILYWVFNKLEDAFEDRPAVLGKKGRSSSVLAGKEEEKYISSTRLGFITSFIQEQANLITVLFFFLHFLFF